MMITFAEALDQLRANEAIDGEAPYDAADIQRKSDEATDIVLRHIKYRAGPDAAFHDETDCPPRIRAAIKLVLVALYDDREGDPLTVGARRLLETERRPTLA